MKMVLISSLENLTDLEVMLSLSMTMLVLYVTVTVATFFSQRIYLNRLTLVPYFFLILVAIAEMNYTVTFIVRHILFTTGYKRCDL